MTAMTEHKILSRPEWQAARDELLAREKVHTRRADELARQRRELPWVAVDKECRFDTEDGVQTLPELFGGRSQLMIYHVMFGPAYEAGCPVNSSIACSLNGLPAHLHARDVTFVLVSPAPLDRLRSYQQRLGWSIPWVSQRTAPSISTSAPPSAPSRCGRGISTSERCRRSWLATRPRPGPTYPATSRSRRR
jgi:predicted dithiol-disulfide oxidoreductase (DUF899 family)